MISLKSSIELINVIEKYVPKVTDRIFVVFDLEHLIRPILGKFSADDKLNILLKTLKYPPPKGPFSDSFRLDLLQYVIDHFYSYQDESGSLRYVQYDPNFGPVDYENLFSYKNQALANSLQRDGYIIKERVIKKMLPEEIEEAKTESELFQLLGKFNFSTAKGHLTQGIQNHSQGNWAGANSQFRPFLESLLISLCSIILPNNKCESASTAINLLGKTASPPFLSSELNEIENSHCSKPFLEGLWKRLHPQGTHPGLSDQDDSTFRYHISIVVGYYLLKRLESRKLTAHNIPVYISGADLYSPRHPFTGQHHYRLNPT